MDHKIKESIAVFLVIAMLALVAGVENYYVEKGNEPWHANPEHQSEFGINKFDSKILTLDSTIHWNAAQQRMAKN